MLVFYILRVMNELKNNVLSIGGNVSLHFKNLDTNNSPFPLRGNLKATMSIKFLDGKIKEEKLGHLLGIENKVWLQVGENDRVFAFSQDNQEEKEETENSSNFFLSFELSNLMIKDLQSGVTLFAGVEHPNYNVRTQEIPREISDSLTQSLHE